MGNERGRGLRSERRAADLSWPVLALGDAVAIYAFAALGRLEHGVPAALAVGPTLLTAVPFLLAWAVVAPVTGAYRPQLVRRPGALAARTALAWLLAGPLALLLRAWWLQRAIPPSFAAVALTVNALFLVGWRWLWSRRVAFVQVRGEQ